jgi:hypothetical protein
VSGESQPTFRRNISSPSSGFNSELSKIPARNSYQRRLTFTGLHEQVSEKTEPSVIIAVATSNLIFHFEQKDS